jgi:hypothetical protein
MWILKVIKFDIYNGEETRMFYFAKEENADNEYLNQLKGYLKEINKYNDGDYDYIYSGVSPFNYREVKVFKNNFYLDLINLLLKYDNIMTNNKRKFSIELHKE